jgi:hypothetical protein
MSKYVFVGIPQVEEVIMTNTHPLQKRRGPGGGRWASSALALFVGLSAAAEAGASATEPGKMTASSVENALAAGEQTQGHLLALAAQAEGLAYEQAMQALVHGYADSLPSRVAASHYTADSWRQDVVAAFALARIAQPDAVKLFV